MIMKELSLLLFALILMGAARAAVRLPHVLSDGMVLQQQSSVRLWGRATPGATVTVTASWDGGRSASLPLPPPLRPGPSRSRKARARR